MRRGLVVAGLLAVIAVAILNWLSPRASPMDSITYRGETIRLSKHYLDYDDYKNDPENIAPEERTRVARLVREAPMPHDFKSRADMIRATFDVRFPGYGETQLGQVQEPDGSVLTAFSIEVPTTGEDRVFVFRGVGESYTMIDDFIAPADLGILRLRKEGGDLVFSNFSEKDVLRRALH